MKKIIPPVPVIVHRLSVRRLEVAVTVAGVSLILGTVLHSEAFKHCFEITIVPCLEAIVSRRIE